jgi:hypothetical protein
MRQSFLDKYSFGSEVLKIFLIAIPVAIVFESIMYFVMGQNLISPGGRIELWSLIINGRESSQQISDWYTRMRGTYRLQIRHG